MNTMNETEADTVGNDSSHRYHLILRAEYCIFSDEVDKYEMLRRIERSGITENCRIAGFILLDNELHMILTSQGGNPKRNVQQAYAEYVSYCLKKYGMPEKNRNTFGVTLQCRPIHASRYVSEVLETHMLCVYEGYVKDLNAYWWSSYQTYRGFYRWSFMCEDDVLQLLAKRRQAGYSAFRKLQRARYSMRAANSKSL